MKKAGYLSLPFIFVSLAIVLLMGIPGVQAGDVGGRVPFGAEPAAAASDPAWETLTGIPTTVNLSDIWGSGGNDIFVVGSSGTILHHDGGGWE